MSRNFFDKSWIHAPVHKENHLELFRLQLFLVRTHIYLLIFKEKLRDVATLAHELGHGVHQYLAAKKQGHFNSATPLTVAETASVFGEMLTFKSILNNEKNLKERKALLANKVEDMLNTVIRQIAFFEFEKQIHTKRKQSELTVEQICNIWMEVQKQSLGPSIRI